jgi:hypothetical protein
MWQILQVIIQGLAYSRSMGWWVGAPFIVIGVILGLQHCSAQMDAKRRTIAIYDALPETMPGWTPKAETSSDEAEGSSQFSRVLEKDGKRLRIMLRTGFVVSRKSEEEFLREVADKPDRVRSVERVAGNTVYLDRVIPTLCVALMFLGDRGLITVSLFVPRGQTADCADALAYLHTIDQGALKQALRD